MTNKNKKSLTLTASKTPHKKELGKIKLRTGEGVIGWVDALNMTALILVGVTLILGIFEKLGAFVGIALLAMYYLAHPSFPWLPEANVEGHYWFVNKNLIELAACLVIYQFPTSQYFGLKRIFNRKNGTTKTANL